MNRQIPILKSIIDQCKLHAKRLDYAYDQIKQLYPFDATNVNELKDEEISCLDQYIFRFSKLQDAIGQKLFPELLIVLGEEVQNKAFIDIFNRLEQLGVIEYYSNWQELRVIRNEVAHEYNESKPELAEKLNKILSNRGFLEKYLTDSLKYINDKGLGLFQK